VIVLTGGAGFIGSHVLARLDERGRDVVVVDEIGDSGKWRHFLGHDPLDCLHPEEAAAWMTGDVEAGGARDGGAGAWLRGREVEAVVHLGACTDTTVRDFDRMLDANLRPSQRWWRFAERRGVPLVYASSAATYGDGSSGFSDDPSLLPRLEPLNAYGYSKHLFDRWARAEAERGRAPPRWVGLKLFNVYGPNEAHKGTMASFVHRAVEQARETGTVRLFESHRPEVADGEQKRDFVYVGDVVEVVERCLLGEVPSGVYNVGTGRARSFNDLVEAVFDALGLPRRIEYFPMPPGIRERYQYFTEAETARLEAAGGAPEAWTSLEEGVARLVERAGLTGAGRDGSREEPSGPRLV